MILRTVEFVEGHLGIATFQQSEVSPRSPHGVPRYLWLCACIVVFAGRLRTILGLRWTEKRRAFH